MNRKLPICILAALSLLACSRQSPRQGKIVDQLPPAAPATPAVPPIAKGSASEPPPVPLKPAKQVEIVRDKDEVERLAQVAYRKDQERESSPDVAVQRTPEGGAAVYYKGNRIFTANRIERTDSHPVGHLMILAQQVGDGAAKKTEGVEYTEGQSIDPLGLWIFANGQVRRITKPNGSAISAKFSPSGKKIAVSEYVQNENHQNIATRCFVVDIATGKSIEIGNALSGHNPIAVGEWISESSLRVFITGEAFLEQAITYEIPSR